METLEVIRGRKSTRAFLPTSVPKDIVVQVLDASRWAPSGSNRQGWRVTVATGAKREILADRLAERAPERVSGTRSSAGPIWADLAQIAERQGQSVWEFVVLGSLRLYDAPVVVVVSHRDKRGGAISQFVTTMLLAAHDLGLGTCWLGYPLGHSDLIQQILEIPEEEQIAAVVALGYPDPDSPANAYRSPRDELETFTRWVGFE